MTKGQDSPELPFPFWAVSNGEWCPPGPSARQLAAARLYTAEADRRARRLGMSRRDFVRSAAGMATGFFVLNTAAGLPSQGSAAVLPVSPEQCDDPEAARELFSAEYFVMDVQLHHVDTDLFPFPGLGTLRFFHPDDPPGLTDTQKLELLNQTNFVKEVFVDSETAVGVLSGVPDGVPMPPATMQATRDLVNQLAGSERAIAQAMIDPAPSANSPGTALSTFEDQVANGARGVKCYTGNGNWRLDDETIAFPMYQEAERLGIRVVNVHKGFPGLGGSQGLLTDDVAAATAAWPNLDFVIYHSAFFPASNGPEFQGIDAFMADIQGMGARHNLFSEVGSTFASALVDVVANPLGPAHLMGKLLANLGSWRIVWGTDSVWWGSPQWQIDAFKILQIPQQLQDDFGYPPLTDRMKARILGRNAARLYGVDIAAKRCEIEADQIVTAREAIGGERNRSLLAYGPDTPGGYRALNDRVARQLAAHRGTLA